MTVTPIIIALRDNLKPGDCPAVFLESVPDGAYLGFRHGRREDFGESFAHISRADLRPFHDLLHEVLAQFFAPGEDARVDVLLSREALEHPDEAGDDFRLTLRDGLLSLNVRIGRDTEGKPWGADLALTSHVGLLGFVLGGCELLKLHDAVCALLDDTANEPEAENTEADRVSAA
jgi:hypothetical protein